MDRGTEPEVVSREAETAGRSVVDRLLVDPTPGDAALMRQLVTLCAIGHEADVQAQVDRASRAPHALAREMAATPEPERVFDHYIIMQAAVKVRKTGFASRIKPTVAAETALRSNRKYMDRTGERYSNDRDILRNWQHMRVGYMALLGARLAQAELASRAVIPLQPAAPAEPAPLPAAA